MARAVAESFFQLLKRERISRRTYPTRNAARQDVFDYIEMFYNPKRKHTNNGMLSPVDFETRQHKLHKAGVWKTRGTSHLIPFAGLTAIARSGGQAWSRDRCPHSAFDGSEPGGRLVDDSAAVSS